MPTKSYFRVRAKAFAGAKPSNPAKVKTNINEGRSHHEVPDNPPQTLQSKFCSAFRDVKDKVFPPKRQESSAKCHSNISVPNRKQACSTASTMPLSSPELRGREVAAQLFPDNEPEVLQHYRGRVVEINLQVCID